MQSSSQIVTINKPTPNFLQAGCPSCHRTNSVKALKGNDSHQPVNSSYLQHNIAFAVDLRSSTGQAAVDPQRHRVLSQALRMHHPASARPSLVAGPGTDSIPSLRSGIPMSQWISAAISR